jgi:hypothetical protein
MNDKERFQELLDVVTDAELLHLYKSPEFPGLHESLKKTITERGLSLPIAN